MQNLVEALEQVFSTHAKDLHASEQARHDAVLAERSTVAIAPSEPQAKAKLLAAVRQSGTWPSISRFGRSTGGGRPSGAKTYGKKREHGQI